MSDDGKLKKTLLNLRDRIEDALDNLDGIDDDKLDGDRARDRFVAWAHAHPFYLSLMCVGAAVMIMAIVC